MFNVQFVSVASPDYSFTNNVKTWLPEFVFYYLNSFYILPQLECNSLFTKSNYRKDFN